MSASPKRSSFARIVSLLSVTLLVSTGLERIQGTTLEGAITGVGREEGGRAVGPLAMTSLAVTDLSLSKT